MNTEHRISPRACKHNGDWERDNHDDTFCANCGRWRDDTLAAREPLREAAQRLYDRLAHLAGGEVMQDDIEALGAALDGDTS